MNTHIILEICTFDSIVYYMGLRIHYKNLTYVGVFLNIARIEMLNNDTQVMLIFSIQIITY